MLLTVTCNIIDTYSAICRILQRSVREAKTRSLAFDGWSATLGSPIFGITWHSIDYSWYLKSVPIATQDVGDASKNGSQFCAIFEKIVQNNQPHSWLGSDTYPHTHQGKWVCNYSRNGYVHNLLLLGEMCGSQSWSCCQQCIHTWFDLANIYESCESCHLLLQTSSEIKLAALNKLKNSGVTQDRPKYLKHDISTRWNSRLAAMITYNSQTENISEVSIEMKITASQIPPFSSQEQKTLAEFRTVLL